MPGGVWPLHDGTMPITQHFANGMYGAVVIDPPGLPMVDREHLQGQGGRPGHHTEVSVS